MIRAAMRSTLRRPWTAGEMTGASGRDDPHSRSAIMTSPKGPRMMGRVLAALGNALLGKTSHDHMKQFTGSDEYWDRAMAAELGWPQKQPAISVPNYSPHLVGGATSAVPVVVGIGRDSPAPEYEPVYGWTRLQLERFLTCNPGYRSTYAAALRRCSGAAFEVNGLHS